MDIKFKKLFKTMVIFFVVFVMIFNSFAAISVSDGSAFVTKAEFSADLNNLSNRMSALENSIDAKIDSLVSSYLSRNGIWNGEKQTLDITDKTISLKNIMGNGTTTNITTYSQQRGASVGTYDSFTTPCIDLQSGYINDLGYIIYDITKTGLMCLSGSYKSTDSTELAFTRTTNEYTYDSGFLFGFNYVLVAGTSKAESDVATYKWGLDVMQNPGIYSRGNRVNWSIPKARTISYFFVSKGDNIRAYTESYANLKNSAIYRLDGNIDFVWESAVVY